MSGTLQVGGRPITWTREGRLKGRPLLVLAHGAGASQRHPFMEACARGLDRRGVCVVRFNFAYMEAAVREGKTKPPDRAPRLLEAWAAVLKKARGMRGRGPLLIGGKSMGGRMASMLLAGGDAPDVVGAVYLGYPLHPMGKPEKLRSAHLRDVPVPQLFVQGERDKLCEPALLERELGAVERARVHWVARGDHSLARSRRAPLADADAWLEVVADFIHEVAREG